MSREDFLDAPSAHADDVRAAPAAAPRPRRPVNGGWVLMVAAGLVAAVTNYAVLAGDAERSRVAALAADAPAGTPVEQLALRMVDLPVDDPAAHHLADAAALARLEGRVTAAALPAGALVRTSDLRLPEGRGRGAMSLPAEAARSVGGLLQPGDVVDVIAGADRAEYVARGLAVLEVGGAGGPLGAAAGGSVTVSVDGDEALRLAQAVRDGPVDLVRTAGGGSGG